MANAPSSWWSRLGLLGASALLALGLAEGALRIAGVGEVMVYAPDPRFGYLMRPSQTVSTYGEPIRINALGLRGPETLDPKPAGVVRVLFLGDSITYGGGRVAEPELFCRRLERLAAADGVRVEAVNVSAPGWSPQNWTAWVEANGLLDSDLVVVVLPAVDRARPFGTLEAGGMVAQEPWLRLTTVWWRVRGMLLPGVPYTDEAMALNARASARLAERVGATPLVAVFLPSNEADPRPDRWRPFEALYPDAVDLRGAAFAAEDYHLDGVHFSPSGHARIAEALYPRLRERLAALAAGLARGGA